MTEPQLATFPNTGGGESGVTARRISPLELLLPDGIAKRAIVLGTNCPTRLLPECYSTYAGSADFAILAPSAAECRFNGWLQDAVSSSVKALAPDGLLYALVPRQFRITIKRLMSDHGLLTGPHLAHLPNQASSRYLVPLSPVTIQYALSNLLFASPQKRRLATLAFSRPSSHELLSSMLPFVGIVARHPDARPLLDWLFRLSDKSNPLGNVIIRARWRARTGTAVLFRFPGCNTLPDTAAKVSLIAPLARKTTCEAEIMTRLGSSAQFAGARIPKALVLHQIEGHSVLLQTVLNGNSVAALLLSQPRRLPVFLGLVTQWLDRWNTATANIKTLDRERLNQELIAPAALLAPHVEEGREYQNWLMTRCNAATGVAIPFVAAHGDLTMSNVLIDEQEQVGVVDWEAGCSDALPLTDFFYAAADAVAAIGGYADRIKAFQACFTPGGSFVKAITQFQTTLCRSLKISADMAELCFHACWLRHAANEYRTEAPDHRRFLKIVQFLAHHRFDTLRWMQN